MTGERPPLVPSWFAPGNRPGLPMAERPQWAPLWAAGQESAEREQSPPGEHEPQQALPVRRALHLGRAGVSRVRALRPTPDRLRVARDLLKAGGPAALVDRARGKLRAPTSSRSVAAEPRYTRSVTVPAQPWPSDEPLVTVVIPNYDNGTYLRSCLESLAEQTTGRFEVLVVDSASTDPASVAALGELEAAPPLPFRVVRRPERHLLGCNRNAGWLQARGRYVCFLDPDDRLAPTYLEACLFHLEVQAYDVVGAGVRYFEGSDGHWGDMPLASTLGQALDRCPTTAPALVRRDLLQAAGGFHDTGLGARLIYEDWKLWVRALALGARLRNVPAQLLEVRVHSAGQSRHAAIPGMATQRAAIRAYNADVLTPTVMQRSAEAAGTRCRVEQAAATAVHAASAPAVLVVTDDLGYLSRDHALAAAIVAWRAAGTSVVIVSERAASPRGSTWASLAGVGTRDVHVLGEMLPVSEWADYLAFLAATKGVTQVWRLTRAEPGAFAARLPTELPGLLVADLLADDFVPRVVV